jgi:hypothetical protein
MSMSSFARKLNVGQGDKIIVPRQSAENCRNRIIVGKWVSLCAVELRFTIKLL